MLSVADTTFERHKTGVGIFTMQGFERRNKESKTTLRRFSNYTGNVLISNLCRVWDIFAYTKGESNETSKIKIVQVSSLISPRYFPLAIHILCETILQC